MLGLYLITIQNTTSGVDGYLVETLDKFDLK